MYQDGRSQYISIGLANLGTAYTEQGDLQRAESTLREAVTLSTSLLTRDHMNTAIAEVKLGRVLIRQERYSDALPFLEGGYATLVKFTNPSSAWVQAALKELATTYDALGRHGDADRTRSKIVSSERKR